MKNEQVHEATATRILAVQTQSACLAKGRILLGTSWEPSAPINGHGMVELRGRRNARLQPVAQCRPIA